MVLSHGDDYCERDGGIDRDSYIVGVGDGDDVVAHLGPTWWSTDLSRQLRRSFPDLHDLFIDDVAGWKPCHLHDLAQFVLGWICTKDILRNIP